MFTVYILYSEKHDLFYTGHTFDLEERLLRHNFTSVNSFTSKYRPWSLFFTFETYSRAKAMKLEKYLKSKHREFIQRIPLDKDLQNYIINKFCI